MRECLPAKSLQMFAKIFGISSVFMFNICFWPKPRCKPRFCYAQYTISQFACGEKKGGGDYNTAHKVTVSVDWTSFSFNQHRLPCKRCTKFFLGRAEFFCQRPNFLVDLAEKFCQELATLGILMFKFK
jgi:hypothetical protein